jgi:hypothetical protein
VSIFFNRQMKSKTTMAFIAITIAILVCRSSLTRNSVLLRPYTTCFNVNNLLCLWVHGGHIYFCNIMCVVIDMDLDWNIEALENDLGRIRETSQHSK